MTGARRVGRLTERALSRVRVHVEDNMGEAVSLDDMAGAACLSPCHFLRLFHRTTGETPMQYLRRMRVERAKRLLAESDLPLSEIAVETGFCDHSHFCRIFRQATGMTPSDFARYTDENSVAAAVYAGRGGLDAIAGCA